METFIVCIAALIVTVAIWMQKVIKPLLITFIDNQKGMGDYLIKLNEHYAIKNEHFDLQARRMQLLLEKFLGSGFNVQCTFIKIKGEHQYKLWVWKLYETRDMGMHGNASSIPELMDNFLTSFYKSPYFTDAEAFPK